MRARKRPTAKKEEKQLSSSTLLAQKELRWKAVAANHEIASFARQRDLHNAVSVFSQLEEQGLVNEHSSSCLLNAYVRCGDVAGAEELFSRMRRRKKVGVIGCTTLLKGYMSEMKMKQGKELLQSMWTPSAPLGKITPNLRTVNTFLRGCLMAGNISDAEKMVFHCQHSFKIAPDVSSWEYLVALLCQGLLVDKVTPILGRLRSEERMACGLPSMYLNLAKACVLVGNKKASSKALKTASDLLEAAENQELLQQQNGQNDDDDDKDDDKDADNEGKVLGGKRAWKSNDSGDTAARLQSLGVYRDHVRAELYQEIESIRNCSTGKTNAEFADSSLRLLKRIFYFDADLFSEDFVSSNKVSSEVSARILSALIDKFGLLVLLEKISADGSEATGKESCLDLLTGEVVERRKKSSEESSTKPKKSSKKGKSEKPPLFPPREIEHTEVMVQQALVPSVQAIRDSFSKCFDVHGKLDFDEVFGGADGRSSPGSPVCLEVCSGAGEWVVQQAAQSSEQRWFSLELRHDRVYKTFARAALQSNSQCCSNLAILGGNASFILPNHIRSGSLRGVFVNYPEPPQQSGRDGEDCQGKHLLTAEFMAAVGEALEDGGLFTLLTDNVWYGKLLLRTVANMSLSARSFCNALPESSPNGNGPVEVEMQVSGLTLYRGKPGPESGHVVDASSYFDRLWQRGQQPNRYFLSLRKTSSEATGNAPTFNRHKRAAGVIMSSSVRGKKMKFAEDA